MNADAIVALSIFAAAQTGALIFFAGVVATTLRSHDGRIEKAEGATEANTSDIAKLLTAVQLKEGIRL